MLSDLHSPTVNRSDQGGLPIEVLPIHQSRELQPTMATVIPVYPGAAKTPKLPKSLRRGPEYFPGSITRFPYAKTLVFSALQPPSLVYGKKCSHGVFCFRFTTNFLASCFWPTTNFPSTVGTYVLAALLRFPVQFYGGPQFRQLLAGQAVDFSERQELGRPRKSVTVLDQGKPRIVDNEIHTSLAVGDLLAEKPDINLR